MLKERERKGLPGLGVLFLLLAGLGVSAYMFIQLASVRHPNVTGLVITGIFFFALLIGLFGLFMVHPNQGKVMQLFGAYRGTAKVPGLRWANPFFTKKKVSLRVPDAG